MTGPKVLTLSAAVEVTAILDNQEAVTGTFAGELIVWSLRTGKVCLRACSARPPCRAKRAVYSAAVFFFFTLPLETNYLRICQTSFHQIVRIGRSMAGDDRSDVRFIITQGTLLWQPNWPITPSFIALTFQNRLEHRNASSSTVNLYTAEITLNWFRLRG